MTIAASAASAPVARADVLARLLSLPGECARQPDPAAVRECACAGLAAVPGVLSCTCSDGPEGVGASALDGTVPRRIDLVHAGVLVGALVIHLSDEALFLPYEPHIGSLAAWLSALLGERRLRERAEHRVDVADAIVVDLDRDGVIVAINRLGSELLGRASADLIGRSWFDVAVPSHEIDDRRAAFVAAMDGAAPRVLRDETVLNDAAGVGHRVAWTAHITAGADGRPMGLTFTGRDVTSTRQDEEAQRRLTRELHAIGACHKALIRAESEQILLDDVCRIICEDAGYRFVWVGYALHDEERSIRPVASAGVNEGFTDASLISWADTERGRGPTGTAVRTGVTAFVQDSWSAPDIAPWRELARERGYRSSISLPLKGEHEVPFGVLAIYASEINAFHPSEVRLLEDLAADLAFGITALRHRAERRRAEEALRSSQALLSATGRMARVGGWTQDLRTLEQEWTDEVYRIHEVGRDHNPAYSSSLAFYAPEAQPIIVEAVRRAAEFGEPFDLEVEFITAKGNHLWVHTMGQATWEDGKVVKLSGTFQDVTERKRADESLRRLNRELRAISDCNQVLVRAEDEQELLDSICRIVCENAGYRMAWVGMRVDDDSKTVRPVAWAGHEHGFLAEAAATWADVPRGRGPTGTAIRTGQTCCVQDYASDPTVALWREDALRRCYRSSIALPLRDEKGCTFGSLTIYSAEPGAFTPGEVRLIEDLAADLAFGITSLRMRAERRASMESLRESRRSLAALLSNLPGMAYRCLNDREWTMQIVSDGCEALTGYATEDLTGNVRVAYGDLIHPDDRAMVWQTVQSGVERRQQYRMAYRLMAAGGEEKWVWESGTGVYSEAGELQALEGFIMDVTDRVRAEESLRKLSLAVEQSPASIIITDAAGDIEYVNARFTDVTGYSLDEVAGRNPRILKSGCTPAATIQELWATITSGRPWRGEFQNRKKTGELYWDRAFISPILDSSGKTTHYVAVNEDITDRRKLEEGLRQAQKLEAVGQLAGGVAHDFNNILTVLLMNLSALQERASVDEEVRTSLTEMEVAAQRAATLTRQLLAFSRRQLLDTKLLDLGAVVANMANMLRRLLGEDIDLLLDGTDAAHWVSADAGMMDQVLMNLCVNARDAMPNGGTLTIGVHQVAIDAEVASRDPEALPGTFICVSVADTGCGMDPDTRKHVFEPFFTTKAIGKGTGLGLATVYGIVKQHNGWINIYSEVGTGTTVRVYLPVQQAGAAAPAAERPGRVRGGSETILVVEDEDILRDLAVAGLRRLGYTVLQAENGAEALLVWERERDAIDLVISDMVMPGGLTGLEVAERVLADKSGLKVIVSSGYITQDSPPDALASRGIACLAKPYGTAALARAVRDCLDRPR